MTSKWKAELGALLLLLTGAAAYADELKFAKFKLTRGVEANAYALTVELPGRSVPSGALSLPSQCTQGASNRESIGGGWRLALEFRCSTPLADGDPIRAPWGEDGSVFTSSIGPPASSHVLRGSGGGVVLSIGAQAPIERSLAEVASEYVGLGVMHILGGFDHLAFVLCLCLLASGARLLMLVTAFTLGHSVSLALAFLGVISFPVPPVEATVALSIAFMAREALMAWRANARLETHPRATMRHFAVVAGFGVLHGLGFASVLHGLGVAPLERTTGLVFFNLGVEIGQLMFVAAVISLMMLAQRARVHAPLRAALLHSVGALGIFWTLERVTGFLRGSLFAVAVFTLCLAHPAAVFAQEPFKPEEVRVEPGVGAGPHLYLAGPNRIHVIDPETLKYKGQISTGGYGQLALSESGDSIFVASLYYSRGWTGTREDVVQIYDTNTLQQKAEVQIPTKHAMSSPKKPLMALSSDGHWLLIQNATPATSVTVVDVTKKKAAGEIPTPGCWGIYPSKSDTNRFTMLCGDGTFSSFTLNARGATAEQTVSSQIFDVDTDPLFIDVGQDGDTLLLISFTGNVYTVSIADKVAKLVDQFSVVQGVDGNWQPGGFQLTAYVPENGVLYVLMHKNASDGGHTDSATEAWAIDVKKKTLLSRTTIGPSTAIAVSRDARALYAWQKDAKQVTRYAIDKSAAFTFRQESTIKVEDSAPRMEVW
jgi:amicyanin-dependent methylamine dehydrogenase large subunit